MSFIFFLSWFFLAVAAQTKVNGSWHIWGGVNQDVFQLDLPLKDTFILRVCGRIEQLFLSDLGKMWEESRRVKKNGLFSTTQWNADNRTNIQLVLLREKWSKYLEIWWVGNGYTVWLTDFPNNNNCWTKIQLVGHEKIIYSCLPTFMLPSRLCSRS